jgi:8-oxo-dGTP pyrophosphatase MutT (NUDIX family)
MRSPNAGRSPARRTVWLALATVLAAAPGTGWADEGMWTFDNPPLERLEEDHGFSPDAGWFEHLRLASVRFNNGGSGSFVSGMGLVMTNHHVGLDCIQKLSSDEQDLVATGFVAGSFEDEEACPDLELNVLVSTEDVTQRIRDAAAGASAEDKGQARKEEIAGIEKECHEETGLRCNVVTLYGGGRYALYRYRKHTDVRLVFAPEQQVAFFGGDHDNFTYPRHDLDVSLFRVYEDGAPFEPEHYLRFSKYGAHEGDLVLVSGNPGYSGRMLTLAQLEFLRDELYPLRVKVYGRLHQALAAYALRGEEQERQANKLLFGLENALKAYRGFLDGLEDEELMARKADHEEDLQRAIKKDKELASAVGSAFGDIKKAQQERGKIKDARLLSSLPASDLFEIAQHVVRLVHEKDKPNEKRLEEYRDSALESLELSLYSEAPVYPDMEQEVIRVDLSMAMEILGPGSPYLEAALGDRTAAEVAEEVAQGTRLGDVDFRRELVEGGVEAVEATDDPMIRLALRVDPITRKLRRRYERDVEAVEETAAGKIALARFEVYGDSLPPDATFTLRLSYGVVKGYPAEGTLVPWKTTFYGMYDRYHAFGKEGAWALPELWVRKKDGFKMGTPLNFVCTADIIGGNSGSPVVNTAGEVVGLVFDGNIQSLVWRFAYTDEQARAVAVHSSAIKRALYSIYDASHIGWELGREGPPGH